MKPINPEFEPIVLTHADEGEVAVVAELVEVATVGLCWPVFSLALLHIVQVIYLVAKDGHWVVFHIGTSTASTSDMDRASLA